MPNWKIFQVRRPEIVRTSDTLYKKKSIHVNVTFNNINDNIYAKGARIVLYVKTNSEFFAWEFKLWFAGEKW